MARLTSSRRALIGAAVIVLALPACGSQVPPQDVLGAQAAARGGAVAAGAEAGNAIVTDTSSGGSGRGAAGGTAGRSDATAGGSSGAGTTGGGVRTGTGAGAGRAGGSGGGGTHRGGATHGGTQTGGASPGRGGTPAASCAGFKDTDHITDTTIPLANIADVSGPVPGLFKGAQQGLRAYVAYFNATSDICGRKLSVDYLDSQTSSSGDQQAAVEACSKDFAIVGSMGAFDDGGAQTVTQCGIPDLRAIVTEDARLHSPVVYPVQSNNIDYYPTTWADFYKAKYPDAAAKAGVLYIGAGAGEVQGNAFIRILKARGYNVIYTRSIPVTEFNFSTYASDLQEAGVKYVQYVGTAQQAVNLEKAFAQQDYHPMFVLDPEGYNNNYVQSGGSAVDGTHIWTNALPFEDSARSPEMQLYLQWLNRTSPGQSPDYFGLFAWGAAMLFTELARKLGGRFNRKTLLGALSNVDNYTGNGLFGAQHVGSKITGSCYNFIVLKKGKWVREGPADFTCGRTLKF